MTETHRPATRTDEDAALAAPPDDRNPALLEAHKTYVLTLIGAALFVGSIVAFILL